MPLGSRVRGARRFIEQGGRADVGVAVDLAVAQEAGIFKAGNQAEDAGLLTEL